MTKNASGPSRQLRFRSRPRSRFKIGRVGTAVLPPFLCCGYGATVRLPPSSAADSKPAGGAGNLVGGRTSSDDQRLVQDPQRFVHPALDCAQGDSQYVGSLTILEPSVRHQVERLPELRGNCLHDRPGFLTIFSRLQRLAWVSIAGFQQVAQRLPLIVRANAPVCSAETDRLVPPVSPPEIVRFVSGDRIKPRSKPTIWLEIDGT